MSRDRRQRVSACVWNGINKGRAMPRDTTTAIWATKENSRPGLGRISDFVTKIDRINFFTPSLSCIRDLGGSRWRELVGSPIFEKEVPSEHLAILL
mmetsp:Transcript_22167/g.54820  ORF Transcript_22167/g.54820 Transcript_22167/m.54820 type:complete len:96 (+) Transcript_22167:146-433(+)